MRLISLVRYQESPLVLTLSLSSLAYGTVHMAVLWSLLETGFLEVHCDLRVLGTSSIDAALKFTPFQFMTYNVSVNAVC